MTDEQLFYTIVGAIALVCVLGWSWQRWRRARAAREPFPAAWTRILAERVPPYRHLPADLQDQLQRLVKMFLHDKTFVGCGGLEVTDEMRVTVAGHACLLLLNRVTNEYHDLRWIYLYPTAFVAEQETHDEIGVVTHGSVGLLGESWTDGKVILSWEDVERGVEDFSDGHNVVLHEFAHQLDHETGSTNGAPILRGGQAAYQTWSSVFAREFAQLQQNLEAGRESLLDAYGATNAAEFFAVATETFFEKPRAMRREHPALYEELKKFYHLDPAHWPHRS